LKELGGGEDSRWTAAWLIAIRGIASDVYNITVTQKLRNHPDVQRIALSDGALDA
jgi:hypothetical protein